MEHAKRYGRFGLTHILRYFKISQTLTSWHAHTHTHTKYRSTRGVLMSEPQRQQDVVGNVTPDLRQVSPSPQTAPAAISITTDDKVPSWHN